MADKSSPNHNVLLANIYFDLETKSSDGKYRCRKCDITCKDNSGHGNLASHVKLKHPCWQDELKKALDGPSRNSGGMDAYVTITKAISDEAKNMASWIEWIVFADLPIYVTENELFRKNSKLNATNYKTVSKYMTKLLELIRLNIKSGLPKTFGLIFDGTILIHTCDFTLICLMQIIGWSCDGEHYIGIFATWVNEKGNVIKRLISCGVQDLPSNAEEANAFGFTAEDIGDYIFDVLEIYGLDFEAIEFITGDNAYVNQSLCTKIEAWLSRVKSIERCVPLVGCASHRLNLAVQLIYSQNENATYYRLVEKVQNLMVDLKTLKNKVKLAVCTPLCPELKNDTRWGSVYKMMLKYVALCEATNHFRDCSFKAATRNLVPSFERVDDDEPSEHETILEMVALLKEFEAVSKWLQTENVHDSSRRVTLYSVRKVFDKLCQKYPVVRRHLSANADIVHQPLFESAVAKIQGNDFNLNAQEKRKVSFFLISAAEEEEEEEGGEEIDLSFLDETLNDAAAESAKRHKKSCPYRSMDHISPTSNIVERLFSRCGIIMRPHRRLMDPSTLEMLIMLRFNKDLWDAREVDIVLKRAASAASHSSAPLTPVTPAAVLATEMVS
jgi:hypothetical protein